MDELIVEAANRFEDLRRDRIHIAQDFMMQSHTDEELMADISNILMLYSLSQSVRSVPQGFVSNG